MIQSKALEVNLASYHVDVDIDPAYEPLQAVMSRYYGLAEGLTTFLKELSHPRKNLQFIVAEARAYALNYFHLLRDHERGPEAAALFVDIFLSALDQSPDPDVRTDAVDDLLLFLQKMIRESGSGAIGRFIPVLDDAFARIADLDEDDFFLFVKSYYRPERLAEALAPYSSDVAIDFAPVNRFLARYLAAAYDYWLAQDDPFDWFSQEVDGLADREAVALIFEEIDRDRIRAYRERLDAVLADEAGGTEHARALYRLGGLLNLPGYNDFVEAYRKIPSRLLAAGRDSGQSNRWKVIFLFHIMNIAGLSVIHEEALRDINRTLGWLIGHERFSYLDQLIQETFAILKTRFRDFPATALTCVLNMGRGVYRTDDSDLVKLFINAATDLGFQAPMIGGVGDDWQIRVNAAHLQNIRVWMELIGLNPKWSTRLLSDLVIHLSVGGVFIKDTDLFPRDVTRLLNADIGPVYNLVKQLCRLFPVYFNDIGAEGELRDISTRIDEVANRKDPLVHFLRKQTHVESSNRVVHFVAAVLRYWRTRDRSHVEPFVPPNIFERIPEGGPHIEGVHRAMVRLAEWEIVDDPQDVLRRSEAELRERLAEAPGISDRDRERVALAAKLFKLLHQKYRLVLGGAGEDDVSRYLSQLRTEAFPDLGDLREALAEPDIGRKVARLLDYLETLKGRILSEEAYEIREDIYKKRHFTVDIPSMYGSYHELKFDALGLAFRIESVVNAGFEEIVDRIDLTLITKEIFFRIYELLRLFDRALRVDGIASVEIEVQLELLSHALETRGFTFTQYLDIFKGFARAVSNIISDYFHNVHEHNLNRILEGLPPDQILDKYLAGDGDDDPEKRRHRISEIFFREKIAMSLGLQQLDLFLGRVLQTLFQQANKVPEDKLRQLLNYDPQRAMTSITAPEDRAVGIIHLGNKGHNLVKLHRLGFPVPPGFIITTEVFRCREVIETYPPAAKNFEAQMAHHIRGIEGQTGKRFGDPDNPLLFSVRSGSSISQPGMMDTFLNVGMNEEIAEGLARRTGNPWFAWDNYRRFIQCFGMSYDLQRDDFDAIMEDFKREKDIPFKRGFSGEEMRALARAYKQRVVEAGIAIPDDPFEQLMVTVNKVLNSWESAKAQAYRKIIGISDDWGTAVTVQSMVYGNLSPSAGTGVVFTHNPKWSEDTLRLWGDFTVGNQGEDVVSGLVKTLPISLIQQDREMRDTDITMETHFPEIYKALKEWAAELIYQRGWSPQEIEFTFEGPRFADLYLLQSRNMAMRKRKQVFTFDPEDLIGNGDLLGNGIGVSGGAMSGRAVFTLEEIDRWRRDEPDARLILLRNDTVPDDIREINAADGLLTARGGLTSHAAVVAHRLGKTCVVGCGNLICSEPDRLCRFDEQEVRSGDFLSIDGQEGHVYKGLMRVRET
ncbi:MAG: PEP/pyruvate-binding domain-containing protein [Desulfococcaceae bacterium]